MYLVVCAICVISSSRLNQQNILVRNSDIILTACISSTVTLRRHGHWLIEAPIKYFSQHIPCKTTYAAKSILFVTAAEHVMNNVVEFSFLFEA